VLRTEEDGAVLLKNDAALPLKRQDLGSLLLIGPGALQTIAVARANEQALGRPERQIGAFTALRRLLRDDHAAHVSYAAGNDMAGRLAPAQVIDEGIGQPPTGDRRRHRFHACEWARAGSAFRAPLVRQRHGARRWCVRIQSADAGRLRRDTAGLMSGARSHCDPAAARRRAAGGA
jgi:hypothetical protein